MGVQIDLSGRTALITGAAKGIGRATALRLGAAGATVIVNYNSSESAAQDVVKTIEERGGTARAVKADVSASEQVEEMVNALVKEHETVDILVNNAGITRDNLMMRMSADEWDSVLNTNLRSAFYCSRAVLRPMLRNRWGRIISVSSVSGLIGNAGQTNYAAAKAGLIGFTRSLAREVASRGITANAVAPGYIETDLTAPLSTQIKDIMMKNIPLGRFGQPDDIAGAVLYLASDLAGYVTGQVITIDGGMVMA